MSAGNHWDQGRQDSDNPYGYGHIQQRYGSYQSTASDQGQGGYGQSYGANQTPYGQAQSYDQQQQYGYGSLPPQEGYGQLYQQGPPGYSRSENPCRPQQPDQYSQCYPSQQYRGGYDDQKNGATYPVEQHGLANGQGENSGDPNERGFLGAVAGGAAGAYRGHQIHHGFFGAIGGAVTGSLAEDAFKKHKKDKKNKPPKMAGHHGRRGSSSSRSSSSFSSSSDDDKKKRKYGAGAAVAGAYAYGHHGGGLPPQQQVLRGNFSSSSASITLDRDFDLIASCRTVNGESRLSSIGLNSVLGNDHGHFVWARGGNFVASARNIHLIEGGKVLEAELGKGGGGWNRSCIRLDERITNDNGDLEFLD